MVIGNFSVPGRPANLDNIRARASALAVGAGGSCLDIFLSSIISLLSPSLWGDDLIWTEILCQKAIKPRQATNQPSYNIRKVTENYSLNEFS